MRVMVVLVGLAGCGFEAGPRPGQPDGIDTPGSNANPPDASSDGPTRSPDAAPDASPDASIDAMAGPACPATYGPFAGVTRPSRYRFVAAAASWAQAELDCADDAALGERATHLIVLDDSAERTAAIGGLVGALNINDQWIGATDLPQEGEFSYITGQATTLAINPSMNANNKDCVRLKSSGNVEARDCDETNRYVCECDDVVADPGRFPNLPDGNN